MLEDSLGYTVRLTSSQKKKNSPKNTQWPCVLFAWGCHGLCLASLCFISLPVKSGHIQSVPYAIGTQEIPMKFNGTILSVLK